MQLIPTRREARLIVLAIQMFWLLCGLGSALLSPFPWLWPLFIVGMAAGFAFYGVVFGVAAREFGRPMISFFLPVGRPRPAGSFWNRARQDWGVLFKIADPRWWHRIVAPATGWPTLLVDGLMIFGLMAAVIGTNLLMRES